MIQINRDKCVATSNEISKIKKYIYILFLSKYLLLCIFLLKLANILFVYLPDSADKAILIYS